jgi:sucrose-6-phosphate hydrolase SacC (GH32 family)
VVDRKNTSGFGKDGKPPLVLMYTAAGPTFTQCLAYSLDGRAVTKYEGNPVLKQVTHGNRDPKIMWYEPTQRWVTVLYVELPGRKAHRPLFHLAQSTGLDAGERDRRRYRSGSLPF